MVQISSFHTFGLQLLQLDSCRFDNLPGLQVNGFRRMSDRSIVVRHQQHRTAIGCKVCQVSQQRVCIPMIQIAGRFVGQQ